MCDQQIGHGEERRVHHSGSPAEQQDGCAGADYAKQEHATAVSA